MLNETLTKSNPKTYLDLSHLGSEQTDVAISTDNYAVITQEGNSVHLTMEQVSSLSDFLWRYRSHRD